MLHLKELLFRLKELFFSRITFSIFRIDFKIACVGPSTKKAKAKAQSLRGMAHGAQGLADTRYRNNISFMGMPRDSTDV